jgi:hypothetical protein
VSDRTRRLGILALYLVILAAVVLLAVCLGVLAALMIG